MGKSKKKRQDFQKVKLKVGRKLQKGKNVTNTSFKTRTVQVTQQLKTGEVTEPNTRKKQNIGELLSQCRHYNTSVRLDAVAGLRELVINFPDIVDQNLAAILEKSSELFIDKDAAVRQGVIKLLKAYLPKVTEKQISPFFPLLCAHLCCAMTHIYDEIQIDSLSVLDILLETFPHLMVTKSNQVLTNFIDQISRKQNQGQDSGSRSLTVNPNSKLSSLKWRTSVLNRLEKFLGAVLDCNKQKLGENEVSSDKKDVESQWSTEKSTCADVYSQAFKHNWEVSGFTLSTSGEASSSDDQGSEKIKGFVRTLVPLLIECCIESVPSKQMSSGAGNLLHSESVGSIASILNVTQLLMECAGMFKTDDQDSAINGKYTKDFQHHFLASFPYSLHNAPGKKGDKSDKNDQISAESINLTICDIMTQLLANQQRSEIPTWHQDIVNYLKDFLSGIYDSKMVGQNSKMVVKVLRRFMMLGVKEDILGELLSSALKRYKGAHHLSAEKMVYLKFFSEACLSTDKRFSVSETVRNEFLQSLPELFTLVARSNHEMAAILVSTMKTAACQKCSDVLDLISTHSQKWFGDDMHKTFLHMEPKLQREMFSLLYFLPSIEEKLYECLVLLTRKLDLNESEVDYMLQVVHNRYKLYSQDQDQSTEYIGFLCSLLVGELKGEGHKIIYSALYANLGGHYIHNWDRRVPGGYGILWTRHVYIVQSVCKLLPLFDNQDQVTSVIETLLMSQYNREVLDPKHAYGICKFAESSSCSETFISCVKKICFSIVEAMEDLGENHEEMDDCDENHEEMGDSENLEETENLKENLRPELLELGHELTMKIPGALKEMFQLVWREMEWSYKLDHVYHAAFLNGRGLRHLRLCRVFLTEERRAKVKSLPGCSDVLKKIVARHQYYTTQIYTGADANSTARQLLVAEMEYLVNN